MKTTSILCALASPFFLLLSACGPDPKAEDAIIVPVGEAVAVFVNGEPISFGELQLAALADGVVDPGEIISSAHPDYERLLGQLVDQRLLAQEAVRLELDQSAEARDRLDFARSRILQDVYTESLIDGEAVEQMYLEQVKLQQLDDEVQVSHILTESREEAETVREALLAGEDFATLAFDFSIDTRSRINGGSLGYISPNDLPDPFPAVIGNTEVGDIGRVFQTESGWHVVRIEGRRQEAPMTLEEMRPSIVRFLIEQQLKDTISELRASASVETPEALADAPATEEEAN